MELTPQFWSEWSTERAFYGLLKLQITHRPNGQADGED
jgi:hypothetical protein